MLYLAGKSNLNSNEDLLLKDFQASMGDALNIEQGSLVWCELYAVSRMFVQGLNFISLLSNQLSPTTLSIFADRFANIFGFPLSSVEPLKTFIGLKEATFGTVPTYSAVFQFISVLLGQVFIDLEYPDKNLQLLATIAPLTIGQTWVSPLSQLFVREWQPRDNKDNKLMNDSDFQEIVISWKNFILPWMPAYIAVREYILLYAGNNQLPNYVSGNNVVSSNPSFNTEIFGTGTAFLTDFAAVALGYTLPIEIVADDNNLYTYHVIQVVDDTKLLVKEEIIQRFTNRTYRTLGIEMDVNYGCDLMCFGI